ncbi:portal protein [Terrihabitans soli]|uniref:Portal protein n=1 Tax=Terrihabitans soli TaxID=708113 RepID=A0A6S6QG02_9HYPH|nr:phage portal protein [Terrihabitans soli]BCJ90033.1 portal protein [Terrihabitans soli]
MSVIGELASWVGRKIGLTEGAFWRQYFGGSSWSGREVTIEGAMKLSAFWAGVRLISETMATLPGGMYERMPDGSRRPRPDHPLHELLTISPNADQTPVEFWEGQVAPVCIVGNSYAEKQYIGDRLVALRPLPFDTTRPFRKSDGSLHFRGVDRGKTFELPESKVFHLKGFGAGGDMGLSPVSHARNSLGGAMDTDEAAARMFGTGLRAAGFLLSPQTLSPKQRGDAQKNLIDPLSGPEGEGKIGLLEAGWKWQPTSIMAKDAEMILSRKFNVEDICRWLGIPPVLIGHAAEGQTMWGSGIEQIMIGWLTLGLRAYIKRNESAVNKRLVPVAERGRIYFEYNIDGLVRADSAGRANLMSTLVQNGLRTRNEMRALDNFPPRPDADELTVQSNLTPLKKLGLTPVPRPVPNTVPADDEEE